MNSCICNKRQLPPQFYNKSHRNLYTGLHDMDLILASQSSTRWRILSCARIIAKAVSPQIDEENITRSLMAEKAMPRDIADTLAEHKAKKVSIKNPLSWVLGCDQVLDFEGKVFGKPKTQEDLRQSLIRLSGETHRLITANVMYHNTKPMWRHISVSHMTMHPMTVTEIETYVEKSWPDAQHSAGGYYFEKTPHLFSEVRGNWFDIMGLSIGPIAEYLNQHVNGSVFNTPTVAAVLGHPIAHSKSPCMHGHWLETNKISGSYIAIDIPPGKLFQTVKVLIGAGVMGFNVTLPHKEDALALADYQTPRAKAIGAANTLVVDLKGSITADNTDGYGFITNLKVNSSDWFPQAGSALVLGAGGASRAVLSSLIEAGAPKIYLSNRTLQRAKDVALQLSPLIEVIDWEDKERYLSTVTTVVNTTSLGMTGKPPLEIDLSSINPKAMVTDLVYTPLETPFLVQARSFGCSVVGGVGMLLHQGTPGFEAWFGTCPIVDSEVEALVIK